MFKKKYIYLDHAGATPIDEDVAKKVAFCEREFFANPSAIYEAGVKVRNRIEESRGKIAKLINAHPDEIIFTGSGTESDAMAIIGVITNYEPVRRQGGLQITNEGPEKKLPHIVTTQIEHPAVLENCKMLEKRGEAEVTYLSVDKNGIVNLDELEESLKENTVLVSVMYANNEIGTVQPIEEIAKIIRRFRKNKKDVQGKSEECEFLGARERDGASSRNFLAKKYPCPKNSHSSRFPLFHSDASQAMNYLPTENIEKLGVDLMTFNSSKIYGPKGVGVLYKKRNVVLSPLYSGGGQEFNLRSGTESVALVAGLSLALEKVNKIKNKEIDRLTKIRDYGIEKLLSLSNISGYKIILNGSKEKRLPNNINISIKGISSELLVIELSARGIFVSEKSACKSDNDEGSYVIKAIRKICPKDGIEEGSLRISLGQCNKMSDMDVLYKELKKILEKYNKWK